ncbi:restriction endonuclease subunit M [Aeromicrobium flavum]|uniref:site-specific DNA-methyltransferase (adenine-specific) n=1 Tax=Aeromicrobium flavum TaxID=416568 RepID=A0A512HR53_9ACTN|nr:DNA adenine methylase [Aeromicrobium flavum]GEO87935.1 restriction endonuclease subunit M [Aeromicrobium flavum]
MSVRYIGSKARVAEAILDIAGQPSDGRFVDAFCGTGAVAAVAAARGWSVTLNDSLPSAVAMSIGATVAMGNVRFESFGGYPRAAKLLNATPGRPGFIHGAYSPASATFGAVERRYFTEANAARIDSMRAQIKVWSDEGKLTWFEEQLLLADLLRAANRVANISGTYGCFLKNWTRSALRDIQLEARPLMEGSTNIEAVVGDVFDLPTADRDTVYFDPPYTKRQYSAYYHLLETIHAGDAPDIGGITGLRPWKDKASEFSYKSRALDALTKLALRTPARRILLSYSNEGHVSQEQLLEALSEVGGVTLHEIKTIGRYRPNAQASAGGDTVDEFVIEIKPVALSPLTVTVERSGVLA